MKKIGDVFCHLSYCHINYDIREWLANYIVSHYTHKASPDRI